MYPTRSDRGPGRLNLTQLFVSPSQPEPKAKVLEFPIPAQTKEAKPWPHQTVSPAEADRLAA